MKLEKREMTLNEKDSITDMLEFERGLLLAYASACVKAERKETRGAIVERMRSLCEEIFFLSDLLEGIGKDGN